MTVIDLSIRNRTKLIVGIDYGTTYSGLSFALSSAADFKDIHPWTEYPGASEHRAGQCQKAPSWIAFQHENADLERDAWGYEVEPGMKTYAWTKLLLDEQALPTEYDDPDLAQATGNGLMSLPAGWSAKSIVTEYLRGMYKMYEKAVIEKVGAEKVEDLPVDYWLTVPATWTERAKLVTRAAAVEAGFASKPQDRLFLIPEPEAAAHLALKSSIHHVEEFVREGSGVMVCDLGGGTVDITSYEVKRKKPSLKLREIAIGEGGKCGGTFVDRNLYKLLASRFGPAFTSLKSQHTGPGSKFMDEFEMAKRDFSLSNPSQRPRRLALPMKGLVMNPRLEKFYDDDMGQVLLTKADMKGLFDPVVEHILKLVTSQANQVERINEPRIETMVLVGGFGSCPYIKDRLGEWCAERNIRLTSPLTGAWSATVCGAVLRGLEGSISGPKRCRRHYGHALSYIYDPAKHADFDKTKRHLWYDEFAGKLQLTGFMKWVIGKGALVDDNTETNTQFIHHMREGFIEGIHTHELYSCSLDDAPKTIDNDRIELVGTVEYSLEGIDQSQMDTTFDASGTGWHKVKLTLNVRMGDEAGILMFRIFHKGKEVGKANLSFN